MRDLADCLEMSLSGLDTKEWLSTLEDIGEEHGFFQNIGDSHYAALIEDDRSTLVVTFESIPGIQQLDQYAQPLGFGLVRDFDWSHLCILSDKQSWFRDPSVYAFFDRLADDGFFDEFDNVLFYGSGPCGYAAATYSVTAPGARVLALNPQATLDTSRTGWDKRFPEARRMNFADRYAYAPDMLDAAEAAVVIHSPENIEDAMHASLFNGENTQHLTLPVLGADPQAALQEMHILVPLMAQVASGQLTGPGFAGMMRARRDYLPYLEHLLAQVTKRKRLLLAAVLCANVMDRLGAPAFGDHLRALDDAVTQGRLTG